MTGREEAAESWGGKDGGGGAGEERDRYGGEGEVGKKRRGCAGEWETGETCRKEGAEEAADPSGQAGGHRHWWLPGTRVWQDDAAGREARNATSWFKGGGNRPREK